MILTELYSPNVVTLSGFAFILVNLATVLIVDPFLNSDCKSYWFYTYAFGLFMYQTFDACDGIHA